MDIARSSIACNSLFFLGSLIAKVANSTVFVLIARRMAVGVVGVYSLALTYNALAVQLASWGLDQLLVREMARRRERVGRYLFNSLLIRLLMSLLVYGVLVLVVTSTADYEGPVAYVLALAGVTVVHGPSLL